MRKVIVVGASSGIGEEVVHLLLKSGCSVGIAARRIDRLKAIQDKYGTERVKIIGLDVQSQDA
ncbi:MAG: SDR family NAD(P)-dependent oxidoreductase, partial [Bacteroidales bacterium]|nr:SDR family NAD(P)-dependent oxidoreductase [Bacteroidales bacterium]